MVSSAPTAQAKASAIEAVPMTPATRAGKDRNPSPVTIEPASGKASTSQAQAVTLIPSAPSAHRR